MGCGSCIYSTSLLWASPRQGCGGQGDQNIPAAPRQGMPLCPADTRALAVNSYRDGAISIREPTHPQRGAVVGLEPRGGRARGLEDLGPGWLGTDGSGSGRQTPGQATTAWG